MKKNNRGQQQRVYGGYLMSARKENTVLWRPYYHPILDNTIIEDETAFNTSR